MADTTTTPAATPAALTPTQARVEVGRQAQEILHLQQQLQDTEAEATRLRAENADRDRQLSERDQQIATLTADRDAHAQQFADIQQLRDRVQAAEDEATRLRAANATLTTERETARQQNAGNRRSGLGGLILIGLLMLLIGIVIGGLGALRIQGDCFGWNNFGRMQLVCSTADGFRFTEVPPPLAETAPDSTPTITPSAERGSMQIEPTSSVDVDSPGGIPATTVPDTVRIVGGSSLAAEPARPVLANGSDTGVLIMPPGGGVQAPTPAVVADPVKEKCDEKLIGDLGAYFEHRGWDKNHIAIIEDALEVYDPAKATPPINYVDYDFWTDDGPNLRAFVRDQRFGLVEDGHVVYASETVRYTIFLCDCGITAIYREIKVIVRRSPPPPPKLPPADNYPPYTIHCLRDCSYSRT